MFLIWSDSGGRVPPASHWGELSGPQRSGNPVAKECRGRLSVTMDTSIMPCFCFWTWRASPEPLPVTVCQLLPGCGARPVASRSQGEDLGHLSLLELNLSPPLFTSTSRDNWCHPVLTGGFAGISPVPFWLCLGEDSAFLGLLNHLALTFLFTTF